MTEPRRNATRPMGEIAFEEWCEAHGLTFSTQAWLLLAPGEQAAWSMVATACGAEAIARFEAALERRMGLGPQA